MKPRFALLLAFLVATVTLIGAPTVSAGPLDNVTCLSGTQSVQYSPGVTATPVEQRIDVTTDYQNCVSLSHPSLHHGHFAISTREVQSCLTLARTEEIDFTITWYGDDGAVVGHSGVSVTRIVSDVAAGVLVEYVGTVTSGLAGGAPFVEQITYPSLNLTACLSDGVQNRNSLTNVTKIGLLV
ncbi:hypothetical protein ACFY8O_29985 [Streptomyces argenteolus]|uniref:Ig-like domain-containing protein n=1 Tax=Streptomyces argenteolus TaxID=67274 RepID=A0ABW6XEG1_9ACTN